MKILKYILIGIIVAIIGRFAAQVIGSTFSGLDFGSAVVLGICMYLCVVVVTCTGIIVSKINEICHRDGSDEETQADDEQ